MAPGPSPAPRAKQDPKVWEIAARAASALFGGYALTYALTAVLSLLFVRGGLSRVDAAIVSTNLALLAYPAVGIWAFACRRVKAAAGWPIGLSLLCAAAAAGLQL